MARRKITQWRKSQGGLYFPQEREYLEHLVWEEKVQMRGVLSIYAYPDNHREEAVLLDHGHNLIVDVGRGSLAALQRDTIDHATIPGTYVGVYDLGYLALGNGSNGGASVFTAGSTALFNETTGAITGVPRPTLAVTTPPPGPPYITNLWSAQLGPAEFNDPTGTPPNNRINEAVLFCLDGVTMFSGRTFANQTKSAGITFEFRWTIIF